MRCRYCGTKFNDAVTRPPMRAACPKCARIAGPVLLVQQGDGVGSFREVMLGQHAADPRRKLLETGAYHFTVFLGDAGQIVGFDLTDRDEAHLLKWRQGKPPVYYGVRNTGSAYRNHNTVFVNGRFAPAPVIAELEAHGHNIRTEVRAALLAGIVNAAEQNA